MQGSSSLHRDLEKKGTDVKVVRSSASLLQSEALCKGDSQVTLLSLHDEVLQEILSRLRYDAIARLRLVNNHLYILFQFCFILIVVSKVNRHFNEVCKKILNKGFLAVKNYHSHCLKDVKLMLPKKDSERRTHPLARHFDLLNGMMLIHIQPCTYFK